ncbi:MAG: YdcF family protein [Bacteroidota bacterium]
MFVLMKLVEMLVDPLNLVLAALVLATVLLRRVPVPAARRLVQGSVVVLLLLAVAPWGDWLLAPLENRVPQPAAAPARVDGIVVLGGAIDPVLSAARGQPALNGAGERLVAMVQLARRYPSARLVYSGGSGNIARQDLKEAPQARALLESLGVDCSQAIFEEQSRNTWENAMFSRALAQPQPGQTWLLVTSAAHMPRALGTFRAAGWSVVPYPVDYVTTGSPRWGSGFTEGLLAVEQGLHEWAGLAYYRLRGWSDSWYPGL